MWTVTMPAAVVVDLMRQLDENGVTACLSGGWNVDALLGEQTRDHADLDLWLPAEHLEQLLATFIPLGLDRILPRPGDRPWNFVLHDGKTNDTEKLVVDLHLYERDGREIHFGSRKDGVSFPSEALEGRGAINGVPMRCEAPEWAVRWHTGYPPRPVDHHDVGRLCERFGLPLPEPFTGR